MVQIFRLIDGMEALNELALGYVAMAAQCKTHGDNRGFERNLDRAQDAYAALRLITDLRRPKIEPEITPTFTGHNHLAGYAAKYLAKRPNAIADNAAALLALPCLPDFSLPLERQVETLEDGTPFYPVM